MKTPAVKATIARIKRRDTMATRVLRDDGLGSGDDGGIWFSWSDTF